MAKITLKGNPIHTSGSLPPTGSQAPDFKLVGGDLAESGLSDYSGKSIILNIFPSIDTPVCATAARRFNQEASDLDNTVVLCISGDLPFAQKRFCAAEGLDNVVNLSTFRDRDFGKDYGVAIVDGPLAGLLARAVVIIDKTGNITYTEQVPEITQEPDYATALQSLA
ncbi:MAG: thiol peroxidase [Desulfuromonas sp.]|nr:MAG: thiol peroxidase [Desulfuromonas sp.]